MGLANPGEKERNGSGQVRTNVPQAIPNSPITQTDFGYTGQRDLPSMGLMDYKARFYDSSIGRFIQPDSIIPNPADPQGWNRYAYVLNRPTLFADPTGHRADEGCGSGQDCALPETSTKARAKDDDEYPFGDLIPDAGYLSLGLAYSTGFDKQYSWFWAGSIDFVITRNQLAVFGSPLDRSRSIYPTGSNSCPAGGGKPTWIMPGGALTMNDGFIWGDRLGGDILRYKGPFEQLSVTGGPQFQGGIDAFSDLNPDTGEVVGQTQGGGVAGSVGVGSPISVSHYITDSVLLWGPIKFPWAKQ